MNDPLEIAFPTGSGWYTLALRDGGWTRVSPGAPYPRGRFTTVWRSGGRSDSRKRKGKILLSPIAALRLPATPRIEEMEPAEVLEILRSEDGGGVSTPLDDPLGELFIRLWKWLQDVEPSLLAWAAGLVGRFGISRLELLTLTFDRRFDAVERMAVDDYIPPPPPEFTRSKEKSPLKISPETILTTAFDRENRLSRALRGYEFRPEQVDMAKLVWNAINSGTHLLVEAGTGIGKSLAYLLPAVLLSERERVPVVVSTNTLNLQEQLLSNDIPVVRKALPEVPFSVSLLKGRSHYFCRLRAREALFGTSGISLRTWEMCETEGAELTEYIIRLAFWQASCTSGDMDEVSPPEGLRVDARARLEKLVDCGSATCLRSRCPYREGCWFYSARDASLKSNIIVMNHALLFRLVGAEREDAETLLSRLNHIILDEAHNLEDVITGQFTSELGGQGMIDFANRIEKFLSDPLLTGTLGDPETPAGEKIENARAARDEARELIAEWVKCKRGIDGWAEKCLAGGNGVEISLSNPEHTDESRLQALSKPLRAAFDCLGRLAGEVACLLDLISDTGRDAYIDDDGFQTDVQHVKYELSEVGETLSGLVEPGEEKIRWVKLTKTREGAAFRFYVCPLEVGDIVREFLDRRSSVVMTSATLTVARRFKYLKSRLGILKMDESELAAVRLETPFDIESQVKVCILTDIAEPNWRNLEPYHAALARATTRIARGFGGGVLVLFNSYADMEAVHSQVLHELEGGIKLLCQGVDGPRHILAERMRRDDGVVLFGTRSFWEGLDVPGEALRCVVLTKLPFANFKDPVLKARSEAIKARGGNEFMDFSVPAAATRLAQGFGRLIRAHSDRGCVFILDSRIHTKRYGGLFLKSLPDHVPLLGAGDEVIPAAIRWYRDGRESAGGVGSGG